MSGRRGSEKGGGEGEVMRERKKSGRVCGVVRISGERGVGEKCDGRERGEGEGKGKKGKNMRTTMARERDGKGGNQEGEKKQHEGKK